MKFRNTYAPSLRRSFSFTLFASALTMCCTLSAQPVEGNGGPPKPPPEALEACKNLSSGQECSFSSYQGNVKGTCWAPEGKPLACKPKDAPTPNSKAPAKKQ
jgi:hypothetical protein